MPEEAISGFPQVPGGPGLINNLEVNALPDLTDPSSKAYGCNETDFEDIWWGDKVALLYIGNCQFDQKLENAANAGVERVVFINNADDVFTVSKCEEEKDEIETLTCFNHGKKNQVILNFFLISFKNLKIC